MSHPAGSKCQLCDDEVEAHRNIRAEPDEEVVVDDVARLRLIDGGPYRSVPRAYYHLAHGLEAIEEDVATRFPPVPSLPVRLFWAPAPGVVVTNNGPVTVRRTRGRLVRRPDGSKDRQFDPGLRTVIAHSRDELHAGIAALVPAGTEWYVPHAGVSPEQVRQAVANMLGADDELTKALNARLALREPQDERRKN